MQSSTIGKARIQNPMQLLPEALKGLQAAAMSTKEQGVDTRTLELVHLRASQINGCSVCVEMHAYGLKGTGDSDDRIFAVGAWHDSPYFNDAERAALALTEAATRISDRIDPVPDDVWDEAAKHYDERGLAVLVFHIALINAFNRMNVTIRQPAGPWTHDVVRAASRG